MERSKSYPERLHEIFVKHLGHPAHTGLEAEVALFIDEIITDVRKKKEKGYRILPIRCP